MIDEVIEVEAETVDEAKKEVYRRVPDGFIAIIDVLSDGKPAPQARQTIRVEGYSEAALRNKLQGQLPPGAVILSQRHIASAPDYVTANGSEQASAFHAAMKQIPKGAVVLKREVLGKEPNNVTVRMAFRTTPIVLEAEVGMNFVARKPRVSARITVDYSAALRVKANPKLMRALQSLPVCGSGHSGFFAEVYDREEDLAYTVELERLVRLGPIRMLSRIDAFLTARSPDGRPVKDSDWSVEEGMIVARGEKKVLYVLRVGDVEYVDRKL
jgi:hypothetical protein